MYHFEQLKLGQFAEVFSGYAFKSQDFKGQGIPAVKISNIKNGYVDLTDESTQYLDSHFLRKIDRKFVVKQGDVLISLTGSHLTQPNSVVGRVARYKYASESLLNQRAGKVMLKYEDKSDLTYLYYLLSTDTIRKEIALLAHGAANQANVSPKDIEKIRILHPPLPIQRKIAAILSAYDDLIENNNNRIAILEKIAEEIYKEWFVRMRFPGHKKVKFHKGVPEGWREARLGSLVRMVMGQSPRSEFYNVTGEGSPFNQGVGTYGHRFPRKEVYCTSPGRISEEGNVLFSVRAPVGRINIADCKMIIGRGLAALTHKGGFNSYLFYMLKYFFSSEDLIGNGAIFSSVGKDELQAFKVLDPEEKLIKSFNDIAGSIDRNIIIHAKSKDVLIGTRDLLLSRLITGKLSVEDLDIKFPPSMHSPETVEEREAHA